MTCLHKSEPGFVLQQNHTSCWVFKLWAQRHTGSSGGRGPSVLWKRQSKTEAHTWVGGSGCWAQAAPVAALPTLVSGQRVYRILRVLVHMIFISALWRGLFPTARYALVALRDFDSLTSRSLGRVEQVRRQLPGLRAVNCHCPSLRLPGENYPKSWFCNSDSLFRKVALCLILSLWIGFILFFIYIYLYLYSYPFIFIIYLYYTIYI